MPEETKLPEPSDTVKKLRETFAPLAAALKPEDEPATVYELAE
jgi:hypothetical protein